MPLKPQVFRGIFMPKVIKIIIFFKDNKSILCMLSNCDNIVVAIDIAILLKK